MQTTANVVGCNIAPNSSPVTYQLYLEDEHFPTLLPLNSPQLSPVMLFAGSPAISDNQLTRMAVRVCDRFDTCTMHYSQPISVENCANLTASIDLLVERGQRMNKIGDPITAISVINSIFLKYDTFNESYRSYETAINATIEYGTEALQMPSLILTKGHYEMVLNALSYALQRTNNIQIRRKLLALIVRFFEKAEAMQSMPSMNTIRNTYSNVMNTLAFTEEQQTANMTAGESPYLKDIRTTFKKIKRAAASQLPLGSGLLLVADRIDDSHLNSEGSPVRLHTAITKVMHLNNVFDVDLRARFSVNQTVTARVQFGEEVKQNFSVGWNCGQKMPCSSVVYSATIFPNESPFPNSRNVHKLSPILDVTIHAPKTGQEQSIKGLLKAAVFEMTVTGNESYGGLDYATKCHYFDEDKQEWRMDDIQPLGIAYNQVGCWSGHLSTFVVLRTVTGINADYIIGVLVACLMGVLIFGMMLVFYVQRKRDDASVNPEVHKMVKNSTIISTNGQQEHISGQSEKPRIRPSQVATEVQTQSMLVTD